MDFSLKNCWDCPIPLWAVAGQFAFLLLVAIPGAWMQRSRRPEVRSAGWVFVVVACLLAALFTRAVPRWGVLRSESPLEVFSHAFTLGLYLTLDLTFLAITLVVARYSSQKRVALP